MMNRWRNLASLCFAFTMILPWQVRHVGGPLPPVNVAGLHAIFLPLALTPGLQPSPSPIINTPRVNAAYLPVSNIIGDAMGEMSIFWFGKVTRDQNYADVRVAYNDQEVVVYVAVFDRLLWYAPSPDASQLDQWDAVSLYVNTRGQTGKSPNEGAYRFTSMMNWWENRDSKAFQAASAGSNGQWVPSDVDFTTQAGWRGNAPNDDKDDRGYHLTFHLPYSSLGLPGMPPAGDTWGLGVVLHDRDGSAAGARQPDQSWPDGFNPSRPAEWGGLHFGLPVYEAPRVTPSGTTMVREKTNGAVVKDTSVGGNTLCGDGTDFFSQWGDTPEAFYDPGHERANIQNQQDVADWPCYAKYYLTFPLDSLPQGKRLLDAKLTLHLFGNAGGGNWGTAYPSLIQVLTVSQDWDEASLSWNNAPQAIENVAQTWVNPLTGPLVWPGVPYTWDVSYAVAQALASGQPLRVAFYESDAPYHSGKYFVTSEAGDWNQAGRPTLDITWGEP